jgi:predicted flap endonuclease-1-like 5' DNA nuclease
MTSAPARAIILLIVALGAGGLLLGLLLRLFDAPALFGVQPDAILIAGGLYLLVGLVLAWVLRPPAREVEVEDDELPATRVIATTPPPPDSPAPLAERPPTPISRPPESPAVSQASDPTADELRLARELVPALNELLPAPATRAVGDDFTRIEGIGLKAQRALYEAGVQTYAQLAEAEADALRALVKRHKLPVSEAIIATWPRQARYLADGDEAGLEAYQAGLPRGRS